MLGEMLCAGFATQNFSWIGSPAATELETVSYLYYVLCTLHSAPCTAGEGGASYLLSFKKTFTGGSHRSCARCVSM